MSTYLRGSFETSNVFQSFIVSALTHSYVITRTWYISKASRPTLAGYYVCAYQFPELMKSPFGQNKKVSIYVF